MYVEWARYLKTDALTNFQNRIGDPSLFWSYEEVLWPQSLISRTYWYYIYLAVNWVPTQYSIPCYSTVFVSSISTWMYGKSSSKWYDSEIFTPSDLKKYENTIIWSFYYVISTASTSFINRNFWTITHWEASSLFQVLLPA